jgi:alcohol dehydrogenase
MEQFGVSRTPELVFGAGVITRLGEQLRMLGARSVVVVAGASVMSVAETREGIAASIDGAEVRRAFVRYDALPESLDLFQGAHGPFAEASPDVVDAIVAATAEPPDAVVAIGGGSAIDTGKALCVAFLEDGSIADYLEGVGSRRPSGRKLPFIAVPTTAGTGSEATKNAVLSRPGPAGFKKSLRHDRFIPDVALIDPLLQLTCGRAQTAASGLDAITQLLEAYISTSANPVTDALALDGLAAAGRSFLRAVERGGTDPDSRAGMAYAAYLSGVCLANAGLGTVHGLAGPAGALSSVPHGVFCGTLLPHVVDRIVATIAGRRDAIAVLGKLAAAGRALSGRTAGSLDDQIRMLTDRLVEFVRVAALPGLSAYGIDAPLARRIAEAGDNKQSPCQFSVEERVALMMHAI